MTQENSEAFDVEDVELMFEDIAPTPARTPVPPAYCVLVPSTRAGASLSAVVDQMTAALRARVAEEVAALNEALGEAKADAERARKLADQWHAYGAGVLKDNQRLVRRVRSLTAELSVAREETDTLISRIRRVTPAPEATPLVDGGGI